MEEGEWEFSMTYLIKLNSCNLLRNRWELDTTTEIADLQDRNRSENRVLYNVIVRFLSTISKEQIAFILSQICFVVLLILLVNTIQFAISDMLNQQNIVDLSIRLVYFVVLLAMIAGIIILMVIVWKAIIEDFLENRGVKINGEKEDHS